MSAFHATRFVALVLLAAVVGCGAPSAKPAADSKANSQVEAKKAPQSQKDPDAPALTSDQTPTRAADEDAPEIEPEEQPSDSAGETIADAQPLESAEQENSGDEPAAPTPHRFMLLSPTGPLVVAITVTIDGQPHREVLNRLIDRVLEAADTDGDGRATWDEVSYSPTFIYGLMGNQPLRGPQARTGVKQQYDIDRDGEVDRREVSRFVTANRGSGRGIAMRTSSYNPDRNRLDSPLRRLLDVDRNGSLSHDEIAGAWGRIISRDVDDDRIVFLDDVKPSAPRLSDPMPRRERSSRGGGPDVAMWLSSLTSWDSVLYALKELYTMDGELSRESFPLVPQLFTQLDNDANSRLTSKEVAVLEEIPPHIVLSARFGGESNDSATATLRLESLAAELIDAGAHAIEDGQSVAIALSGVELEFFAADLTSGSDYETTARQRLGALDTDSNGYLDREEFSAAMMQFMAPAEAVDQDGDEKIQVEEIARFMEQKQVAARSQIVLFAGGVEDALFSTLDGNYDARLDERELAETPGRLRALDTDADGEISVDEIPARLSIRIMRGLPATGETRGAKPPATPKAALADVPRWFVRMDANGDGSISRREFLGTSEQFKALDLDGDNFVDSDETQPPDTSEATAGEGN